MRNYRRAFVYNNGVYILYWMTEHVATGSHSLYDANVFILILRHIVHGCAKQKQDK